MNKNHTSPTGKEQRLCQDSLLHALGCGEYVGGEIKAPSWTKDLLAPLFLLDFSLSNRFVFSIETFQLKHYFIPSHQQTGGAT